MVLHKPCTTNSKRQKCNYFGGVIMLADLSLYSADLCHLFCGPLWSFAVFSHTEATRLSRRTENNARPRLPRRTARSSIIVVQINTYS